MCVQVLARLPQRPESTFKKKFFTLEASVLGWSTLEKKKIAAFEADSAECSVNCGTFQILTFFQTFAHSSGFLHLILSRNQTFFDLISGPTPKSLQNGKGRSAFISSKGHYYNDGSRGPAYG